MSIERGPSSSLGTKKEKIFTYKKKQWNRTRTKGKEYSTLTTCHKYTPPHSMSFGWRILILCISFLNVEVDNDFMNKYAKLSIERVF